MRLNQHLAESVYKGVTIGIAPKDFAALDSTHDDVVKRTRSSNSGFSWHTKYKCQANLIMSINISIPVPYAHHVRSWNFCEPFPSWIKDILGNEEGVDKAEEQMVWIDHDYIDRIWDVLSDLERKYWEGFFAWVLFSPDILKDWAGVDVLNGKTHRIIEGQEIWEECPYTKAEYRGLRRYEEVVKSRDKRLRDILERYR